MPDAEARELYVALLARGGLFPTGEVTDDLRPAFERLRAAGLVAENANGMCWVVNPRAAAARLGAGLRAAGVALLAQADQAPTALADLTRAYDQARRVPARGTGIQHLGDHTQIQWRLEDLALECRREILTMQPGGARPAEILPLACSSAREWRERGIALRTIYQPGARTDPGTAAYAAYATGLGARIRVLDEPFLRTLILDREVVVIAGYEHNQLASFIDDPVLVEVVVAGFERDWARAERVRWEPPTGAEGPLAALLARGLTQGAIANRLGLSERTVAAQIAALREEYDAQTLFELGWLMRADGHPDSQG